MSSRSARIFGSKQVVEWVSVVAILLVALLFLKYKLAAELSLLVHPRFNWLILVAILILSVAGFSKAISLLQKRKQLQVQHLSFLPGTWANLLLIIAALMGLFTSPQPLNSGIANQQGITDNLISLRIQPQSFRASDRPEQRSMLDWAKSLMAYPEPDRYAGQKANVTGFVVRDPKLPEAYLILTRFVIMHCVLDAFPVGIAVKLPEDEPNYSDDTWLQVQGLIQTETLAGKRQIVIHADLIQQVPQPKNPYEFN